MDELNSNLNGQFISMKSVEEQSSLSSSFILQPLLSDDQHEENVQYKLKVPLCISQLYQEEFFDRFHMNYYGELEDGQLFLASIRSIPINPNELDKKSLSFSSTTNAEYHQLVRATIRTKSNNYDVSEIININNEENIFKILFSKAQLSSVRSYQLIHYIKGNEKILQFDKSNDDQYTNKVAFIFQGLNQINENEILGNNQISIKMENFLNLISERVQLKDFNKYRGDLDIKTDQHGSYSYYTSFENHQIMFNIAPIIPSDHNDQQFIQRKSLIANALLCIVFQEEGTLFKPDFILGKVTQVYITIQPIQINSQLYYKIEIWRRLDIEPIVNPSGGIYKHDQLFRNSFLTLILNTINTILKKEFFHTRIIQQRQQFKNDFIQKLSQLFQSYSENKNYSDDENSNYNLNITEQTPTKQHRFSFIPKIIGTFTNNRPVLSSYTLNTPILYEQDDLEQSTDTIASLITNMINFIELNNHILSSTSVDNNNTIKQDESQKYYTNPSAINNNQDTQINQNN